MSDYSAEVPVQRTRLECPIGPCPWVYDDPGPSGAVASEADITAVLLAHAAATEDIVRDHLETHSLLEWVQETERLRMECWRAERDAGLITAILLRRLGGMAEITDAELAAEDGMLVRGPVTHGFRLGLYDRARF